MTPKPANAKQKTFAVATLLCITLLTVFSCPVNADDILTTEPFALSYGVGESFIIQDLSSGLNLTFTVSTGALSGTAILTVNSIGGTFTIIPTASGTLTASIGAFTGNFNFYVNGAKQTTYYTVIIVSSTTITVTWDYTSPVPTPSTTPGVVFPNSINYDYLWQYLNHWDLIGFIVACWTFKLGDSFFVILSMVITLAIYIKLKSLSLMIVMWFLLGGIWIAAVPMVSPVVYLLFVFGVASILFKIFGENKL